MSQAVLGLACCIERARRLADGDETSTSEAYWYTREAVMGIARASGIRVQDVLLSLKEVRFPTDDPAGAWFRTVKGYKIRIGQSIISPSEEHWTDVAHPDILVREVMEA